MLIFLRAVTGTPLTSWNPPHSWGSSGFSLSARARSFSGTTRNVSSGAPTNTPSESVASWWSPTSRKTSAMVVASGTATVRAANTPSFLAIDFWMPAAARAITLLTARPLGARSSVIAFTADASTNAP
jgi:hypothetical protein